VSDVIDTTPPPAPPAAPTDLAATGQPGPQVSLTWADNSLDETGFVIERATDGVTFSLLASVPADTTTYTDLAVQAGGTYDYRVAAVNLGGASTYAGPVSVTLEGPQPPAAPSGLEANAEDIPAIDLAWVDNSLDETGFVIERATDGVTFSLLANVPADTTAYTDLAVLGGYTYTYRVAAVSANGSSAYSEPAAATIAADATPPAAPSNLVVSNLAQTSLTLSWTDNSNNEANFIIQIATNSSFTRNLLSFTVGPDTNFYNITGLRRNTRYYIRVQAINGFNEGAGPFPWSPVLNVTTAR
jgi:predicted phage tail protein